MVLQRPQCEGGSPQPAQLFSQSFRSERLFVRLHKRHGGFHLSHIANLVTRNDRKGLCGQAMHLDRNRTLKARCLARKGRAKATVQFRIARLPKLVADMNAAEVDVTFSKSEFDTCGTVRADYRGIIGCGGVWWVFRYRSTVRKRQRAGALQGAVASRVSTSSLASLPQHSHLINPSAFLCLLGFAGVENHAIARFEGCF